MKAHRLTAGCFAVFLACLSFMAQGSTNSTPTLSLAQMQEDLRQLTAVTKSTWAYAEYRNTNSGVDLDQLLQEKLRKLPDANTREEFAKILREFIANMQDGHAGISFPDEAYPRFQWPFEVVLTREGSIVNKIDSGETRLALGYKLLRIDKVPIEDLVKEQMKRTSSSSPEMRRHNALRALFASPKEKMLFEFEDPAGNLIAVDLPTKPAGASTPLETIRWHSLDNETGYLRIPSFRQNADVWEKAKAQGKGPAEALEAAVAAQKSLIRNAFKELAHTRRLIVDLRGNSGGTDLLGMYVSRFLVTPKGPYYVLETHLSPELLELPEFAARKNAPPGAWTKIPIELPKTEPISPYPGKVAVLMDEGCFSATDNFVSYLACAAPGIVFVGRPNGAGSGAPRQLITLKHSQAKVTFCVMRVWNTKGALVEGNPIQPHVAVEWTRQDIIARRDPDLQAALQLLHSQTKPE